MNLAIRDIRRNLPRFVITLLGVGLLITASVGMNGLYRGIVADATLLIDRIGADYWVVQGGREGPFAEASSSPRPWTVASRDSTGWRGCGVSCSRTSRSSTRAPESARPSSVSTTRRMRAAG
ncbi:hypothetical protein [Rubrimonas cliftonensis]|uniref:hypothetical protein n=1 Tax=Rubrimonas cliftonensis TaxID=89524 RepID=UPI001C315260|nr:hypothetical protein [Rubrimonas cliftonensis]